MGLDPAPASASRDAGVAMDAEAGEPAAAVTALYSEHALSLIRLAHVMLGDRAAAEDVVHDAFYGLYRRWEHLAWKDRALGYVRVSVLNGCRSVLRARRPAELGHAEAGLRPEVSAEAAVLTREERRELVAAVRRLPDRQREVVVLGYYLGLSDEQIARDMGIRQNTIRSARHRALAALARSLGGTP